MTNTRSLKAILFADAVGYSRMVHDYESATLAQMRLCFELFQLSAANFHGELVKTTGDGAMVEFDSAVSAVEYAATLHLQLEELNAELSEERQLHFRMGIHLGEVLSEAGDRYGNIVNIAARLEGMAEPGGICISQTVYEQARHRLTLDFKPLGQKFLKNIPEPMLLYSVLISDAPGRRQNQPAVGSRIEISTIDEVAAGLTSTPLVIPIDDKIRALLGYLALSKGNSASNSMISRLLWSDLKAKQAVRAAEAGIEKLQQFFSDIHPDLFFANAGVAGLQSSMIDVDLLKLADAVEAGEIDERLTESHSVPSRILTGLEDLDPAFASWLKVTRNTWQNRLTSLLEQTLAKFRFDTDVSKLAARALLAIDPTHEQACQRLVNLLGREGKAPAAMRIFKEFERRIAEEFDLKPSPETKQLIERLRQGDLVTSTRDERQDGIPLSPSFQLPSVQVSPFQGLENAGDYQYLLSGFQNEIKSAIGKFRELVLHEADSNKDETKPDYRLVTFCANSHSQISINVTLVDCKSNRYIWSESYPMSLSSWISAQRDIIRRIAASLNIYLSAERVSKGGQTSGLQLEPFDKWLRGEDLLNKWDPALASDAEALFREVIDEAPKFAPAFCSLASSMNIRHLVFPGTPRSPDRVELALQLAKRAVEIDPLETRAQLTLAWSLTMAENFDQAELHYELARELNPNSPRTLISCSQGFAFTNQLKRSAEMESEALSLTPSIPEFLWAYLACARYVQGRYKESIEAADQAGNAILDMPGWRALSFAALGQKSEAKAAGSELLTLAKSNWVGDNSASDEHISRWFLKSFPIRNTNMLKQMRNGLKFAGLSV